MKISFTVNGKRVTGGGPDNTLLVDYLRSSLRLTGTHVGCDTAQCGACTVLLDGKPVKACAVLLARCEGSTVTTIEGLARNGKLHPVQAAFKEHHGLQCGFCTPGMVMAAVGILERNPKPGEAAIRRELEGNLCRCTGYHNIVKAIQAAAEASA
ncbi:MAG TPA: (2Fe-2S)-binding protein [Sphingomonadales bacterium]|nr:(2Fe-2S)-binding protein [Sphingomonadales bacterium]